MDNLPGPVEQRDQQQQTPVLMLHDPGLGQVRIGDHCDDVEDEQHAGREAPAQAQHQQDREEQLGEGAGVGRHLGRQQRHAVLVLEQRQAWCPSSESWSVRTGRRRRRPRCAPRDPARGASQFSSDADDAANGATSEMRAPIERADVAVSSMSGPLRCVLRVHGERASRPRALQRCRSVSPCRRAWRPPKSGCVHRRCARTCPWAHRSRLRGRCSP